jgi:starch synthase
MRIVHIAAEASPYSKVGGLADVAGALPAALVARGHDVTLVTPLYRGTDAAGSRLVPRTRMRRLVTDAGVEVLLLDRPELFNRATVYGQPDDGERFAALCEAGLKVAHDADVIHAHDWHAALACLLADRPTVLTIHNLSFHGEQSAAYATRHGLAPPPAPGDTWPAYVNLLGRGIAAATIVTTVSPTYAREIQTPERGHGLDALLKERGVTGIANGIDTVLFDPATDANLEAPFSARRPQGRRRCRRALRKELGLQLADDAPVVGVVSRLTEQKGLDLLLTALPALRSAGAGLAVVGSGDERIEAGFRAAALADPAGIAARIGFDASLGQRIYAGCDLFAMPSRFEPCGLGQLIAMRYGALPVVRRTGGLADTVTPETGFLFDGADAASVTAAFRAAIRAFHDDDRRKAMIRAALRTDHSWAQPAAEYEAVYERAGAR